MKVIYEFATREVVEVEVDEKLGNEIIKIDRQVYNNNHKETRRHISLDCAVDNGLQIADATVDIEQNCFRMANRIKLYKAAQILDSQQKDLIRRVFFNEEKYTTIAKELGITRQSVKERLDWILKKLKKNF
jgi:RNA polymerase sigma-70 factor (ECF subfamily)